MSPKTSSRVGTLPSEQVSTTSPAGHRMDTGDRHELLIHLPVVFFSRRDSAPVVNPKKFKSDGKLSVKYHETRESSAFYRKENGAQS